MTRRKPKLISRKVADDALWNKPRASSFVQPFIPPPKTEIDKLYDIIFDESVKGYRFTDEECGEPWISKSDIEIKDGCIYVVRFRCPLQMMKKCHFWNMANDVCAILKCDLHFIHDTKQEHGIPFEDCVWVLQKGELSQEKEGADSSCESTPEEIDERIEEALENFV